MTAEQQLERSVLEGKEREELNAIAQAMSLKTTTRTKKADIISQILDATGVTTNGDAASGNGDSNGTNGTKPTRRPRVSASATAEATAEGSRGRGVRQPGTAGRDRTGGSSPGRHGAGHLRGTS